MVHAFLYINHLKLGCKVGLAMSGLAVAAHFCRVCLSPPSWGSSKSTFIHGLSSYIATPMLNSIFSSWKNRRKDTWTCLLHRCLPFPSAAEGGTLLPALLTAVCAQEVIQTMWVPPYIPSLFHVEQNKWECCLMHHLGSYCICQESAILLNIRIEFLTE